MSDTIPVNQIEIEVVIPRPPNFVKKSDGEMIPIGSLTDEALEDLAERWKKKLFERANQQRKNATGGLN